MAALTCYRYDEYGAFFRIEAVEGERTQHGDVMYRLPFNATIREPPEQEGKVAVFDWKRDLWVLMPDHRGETWKKPNGESVLIQRPGYPGDWGLLRLWP